MDTVKYSEACLTEKLKRKLRLDYNYSEQALSVLTKPILIILSFFFLRKNDIITIQTVKTKKLMIKKKHNSIKIAFTLSEVMLVLSVIGIIAAMTIPGIVQNLNERQYKITWKKAFSDLNQIFGRILDEQGDLTGVCSQNNPFINEFTKYIGPYKSCGPANSKNCFWTGTTPPINYKSLGKTSLNLNLFDDGQIILTNGAFVMFENPYSSANPPCIAWYDINGYLKGPNTMGIDLFGVQFQKDKIIPLGSPYATYYGDCSRTDTSANSGMGCAAKVLMNEDY